MIKTCLAVAALFCTALALAAEGGKLDDALLDPAWFGPAAMEFRKTDDIDYLWVKPGFSIEGRTIHVAPWEDFVFLQKAKRDAKDASKAGELTELMPSRLRGMLVQVLDGKAKVSRDEGDLVLVGRFVDVNAGSKAAKWIVGFGAGSATATWDLKLVDRASGEVLAAIHHRAVSGTNMSEIDDKIAKWLERFGTQFAAGFPAFQQGKVAKK